MTTTATQNTPALTTLKEQHQQLVLEREIAQARVDIRQLTELAEQGRVALFEDFGDLVDRRGYLYDDPTFDNGRVQTTISRLDDRTDGRYRPVYETEQDLQFIRGAAHVLTTSFGSAINVMTNLKSYTISSGFTFEAEAEDADCPAGLVDAVQKVIDEFLDRNDWPSDMESEAHDRSREDGECAIVLEPRGWQTHAKFVEPDQITQPASPLDLECWLGTADQFVNSWTFGVHTRKSDPADPLGYHCVFDGNGSDWQYYPDCDVALAMRLGTGVMEFIKRNVPRNVKRGVSDFYPVVKHLEQNEKLLHNTSQGAAIQAAIAFIRSHLPGTTRTGIESLQSTNATSSYNKQTPGGTKRTYKQNFAPGTIIDTAGTEYKYGPMGQSSAPNFIAVIQAAIRYCGSRWAMPEFMISSDASNANYASTLVAGSPFVQAREADQRFYGSRFHRMMWKVIEIAYHAGFFSRFNLSLEKLKQFIKVTVTPPTITITDKLQAAQIRQIDISAGLLSKKTAIKESGRDPEVEAANIREERGTQPLAENVTDLVGGVVGRGGGVQQSGDGTPTNVASTAALNGAQITAAKGILDGVSAGTTSTLAAVQLLVAVGIDQSVAQKMVESSKTVKPAGGGSQGSTTSAAADSSSSSPAAFGNLSRRQWQNNGKAIRDVLKELAEKTVTATQAEVKLQTLGLPLELVKKLMADVADDGKLSAENQQAIAESLLESAAQVAVTSDIDWMTAAVKAMGD